MVTGPSSLIVAVVPLMVSKLVSLLSKVTDKLELAVADSEKVVPSVIFRSGRASKVMN